MTDKLDERFFQETTPNGRWGDHVRATVCGEQEGDFSHIQQLEEHIFTPKAW